MGGMTHPEEPAGPTDAITAWVDMQIEAAPPISDEKRNMYLRLLRFPLVQRHESRPHNYDHGHSPR